MIDLDELSYWYKFIDGDLDALSVLFLHYAKGLCSYGMKIYRDEELVKDSIQEVFIQLIQKRHQLKRSEKIKGLIYRLLRNTLIDEIKLINRSKKIDHLLFNASTGFETDVEHQYIGIEDENKKNRRISFALNQLSIHQREAMFLKYSDGLSYEVISQVMGISVASTRTLIYRSLKQLKSELIPEKM